LTENTIQTIKISRIINDCKDVKTLIFKNNIALKPKPGQFAMIWVPGVDEIPMSISACDDDANWAITVKDIGECTHALHELMINNYIGVRGPLGNYFKIPNDRNKNIILVGGGIGMAPLRFFANELYKLDYHFKIIQCAKESSDLLYIDEISQYNPKSTETHFCTDDGSYGEEGTAIDIFEKLINDYTPKEGITLPLAAKYAERLKNLGIDAIEISCGNGLFSMFNVSRGDVPVKEMGCHSLLPREYLN